MVDKSNHSLVQLCDPLFDFAMETGSDRKLNLLLFNAKANSKERDGPYMNIAASITGWSVR